MPRPVRVEALSDAFVWRLSVAYIGNNSRTERPRETKIDRQVAHVTCDSDTTFKVKRSKVNVTRPVYSPRHLRTGSCSGQRGNVLSVGNCCKRCRLQARQSARRREALRRPLGEERGGAYCVATRTACCCCCCLVTSIVKVPSFESKRQDEKNMLKQLEFILSGCVGTSALNSDRVKSHEKWQPLEQEGTLTDVLWQLRDAPSKVAEKR